MDLRYETITFARLANKRSTLRSLGSRKSNYQTPCGRQHRMVAVGHSISCRHFVMERS